MPAPRPMKTFKSDALFAKIAQICKDLKFDEARANFMQDMT